MVASAEPKGHLSLPETRDKALASVHVAFGSSPAFNHPGHANRESLDSRAACIKTQSHCCSLVADPPLPVSLNNVQRCLESSDTFGQGAKTQQPCGSRFVPLWLQLQTCRDPPCTVQGACLPALPAACAPCSRKHVDRARGGQTKAGEKMLL